MLEPERPERAVYEAAGKYNVMRGTAAFDNVRWRKGEREHHDQRVSIKGHLNRKVLSSCMGPLYYHGSGWCACYDGTLNDSKYMIHYHHENDEFQMDKQTVACIGRNSTVASLEKKMSDGPVPLTLREDHEKETIMLYTREFVEKYCVLTADGKRPPDLADVQENPVARYAEKWAMCVIRPWKFTSIVESPKTDTDAGKVWGEINDGEIKERFVLLCETLPEDGMMRWFDPRSLESMEFDYDLDPETGETVGEPFLIPDWAGKDDVLVSRNTGTISHRGFSAELWDAEADVGITLQMADAITGGSFVFHKPNLKGMYNYDELFHDCEC